MASEEGRGTGLASSVVLFILEITSQVPTRFPAPSGGGWPSACQPPLPTCRGSQGPTWISLWTSAESGSLTPQETMERDGSRNASPAGTSPARASPSRSASGRSLSVRSASTASSPTRVYLVRATPVGAVPIRASPARSAPATRESPGVSLPKFTWQEGQKRLPLIGCILLLIALVVSLIILYGGREPQSPRGMAVYFWRGHTGIKYKEPVESCPIHAVRCDGVVDCKLRSDELGCVRFDWNKSLLKVYSGSSHQWLPICSDSWNDSYSEKTCQQLGFMSAYRTTEVAHRDLTSSLSISKYNSTLQESLYRSECPSQQYVSLQCSRSSRATSDEVSKAVSVGGLWTEGHDRADRGRGAGPREQVALASESAVWHHAHLRGHADRRPVGAHRRSLLLCDPGEDPGGLEGLRGYQQPAPAACGGLHLPDHHQWQLHGRGGRL
ncbi:transmembrane protease serine 13 isoform X4 [Acinonyx jubatus]|uniref:Transmembrane protease serine 13 isoform X4 n=1 Tax=Acinonyx jubatus TaxID=32536 RepID=A0ABM3NKR2_ACIJB|nr:transmembrane protease serine 13 isoform X4 [Acinonyx jubatus]